MEWTIARDRWQSHLKTRGTFYADWAAKLQVLHAQQPENGASTAAAAMRTLAALLERCRLDRLTRHQYILFRLGELIAHAEAAAVFAERVCDKATTAVPLDVSSRQALARIYAREAALKVAEGVRWVIGAGSSDNALLAQLPVLYNLYAGQIADMDLAAAQLNQAFGVS
jgi:hypothetical protein